MESQINDIKAVLDNDLKRKRDDLINKRDRIKDVNVMKNDLNQRNKEHKAVVRRLGRLVKRITGKYIHYYYYNYLICSNNIYL